MRMKATLSSHGAGVLRGGTRQSQGCRARTSATQDQTESAADSGEPGTERTQEDHDTRGWFKSTDDCFTSASSRHTGSCHAVRRRCERHHGAALRWRERSARCAYEPPAARAHAERVGCCGLSESTHSRAQAGTYQRSVACGHTALKRHSSAALAVCAAHAHAIPAAIPPTWCAGTERLPCTTS